MSNFINREILLKELEKAPVYFDSGDIRYGIEIAIEKVKEQPIVNTQEVKSGKWNITAYDTHWVCICSNCKARTDVDRHTNMSEEYPHCPKCGAKMTGGE